MLGLIAGARAHHVATRLDHEARSSRSALRLERYGRDVGDAGRALASNDPGRARELLGRHIRALGEADLRGFA